ATPVAVGADRAVHHDTGPVEAHDAAASGKRVVRAGARLARMVDAAVRRLAGRAGGVEADADVRAADRGERHVRIGGVLSVAAAADFDRRAAGEEDAVRLEIDAVRAGAVRLLLHDGR